MNDVMFSDVDLTQLESLGMSAERVRAQIETFKKGNCCLKLSRPCTISDGITTIPEGSQRWLIFEHEAASRLGRLLKFVPAAGAASRMFEVLLTFHNQHESPIKEHISRQANEGDSNAIELLRFMEGLHQFAFYEDLRLVMFREGFNLDDLKARGEMKEIIGYLLFEKGLNYANSPKALLKFHRHSAGSRTALEEHLVEAAEYVRENEGVCRLHLTVSPEHREKLLLHLDEVTYGYETKYGVKFQVEFSVQERCTNTIAVDMENRPFRDKDGSLLFRPAGHGALLENLNGIKGDIIYIKNIDNVTPDHLKHTTVIWKKLLGGCLITLQKKIYAYLNKLAQTDGENIVEEAMAFARDQLFIIPKKGMELDSLQAKKRFLVEKLNRPLRICGMVKNQGEPGGGPFWVEGKDGSLSLQIVESAQVDMKSQDQREKWNAATHFNPVDIVCGVRDFRGEPFDLKQYVDEGAVFISKKSKDGRELKALELPGLWNGAMADWITFFVEVPITTFNPVKTISDLLRKEHQPQ